MEVYQLAVYELQSLKPSRSTKFIHSQVTPDLGTLQFNCIFTSGCIFQMFLNLVNGNYNGAVVTRVCTHSSMFLVGNQLMQVRGVHAYIALEFQVEQ